MTEDAPPCVNAPVPDQPRWEALRAFTPARIGLGRSGDTMPLRPVLDLQLAHAQARDAVHASLDREALRKALAPRETILVESAASDRSTYLRRPDLGRKLSMASGDLLRSRADKPVDCAFIIADGLSATAVDRHAAPLLDLCLSRLSHREMVPIIIAAQARVALGDIVGSLLRSRLSIVLIGERPGLSVADSLGVYITFDPRPGRRDSERNCISNIHSSGGLSYGEAADMVCWLVETALTRNLTGTGLKEGLHQQRLG